MKVLYAVFIVCVGLWLYYNTMKPEWGDPEFIVSLAKEPPPPIGGRKATFNEGVESDPSDPLLSGLPRINGSLTPYHPLLCKGRGKLGTRWCKVCGASGGVVLAFVRDQSETVLKVIELVETSARESEGTGIVTFLTTKGKTAADAEALPASEINFLNDGEKAQFETLKEFSKEMELWKTSISIYPEEGPANYGISSDAALTVIITNSQGRIRNKLAFRQEVLNSESVEKIRLTINEVFELDPTIRRIREESLRKSPR